MPQLMSHVTLYVWHMFTIPLPFTPWYHMAQRACIMPLYWMLHYTFVSKNAFCDIHLYYYFLNQKRWHEMYIWAKNIHYPHSLYVCIMLLTFKDDNTTGSFWLCLLFCVLSLIIISDYLCTGMNLYTITICTDATIMNIVPVCY